MSRVVIEARATLLLAVPIILGQVSQMLMGAVDSLMIGQVGTVPLAASAFAGSVFAFFYVSGLGLCFPVAVLVSRAHGAGQPKECGEWLRHGLALAVSTGIVALFAMEILGTQLGRLGQPPEVVAAAQPFFSLIAASLLPALGFQALRQFAESLGRPWLPMVIMLCGVAFNVGLNWILIYGHLGAPALGLAGAGVATLTARCMDLLVLWLCLRTHERLRPCWPAHWCARLEWPRLRELLRIGVPAAGQLVFEVGAFTVAAWMMGRIGTVALAAHQIALSCASLTFMFPLGLSMAAGMRVSQALGAGRREWVRPIGFGALGMAFAVMGVFGTIFWLGGPTIARSFVEDDAVVKLAGQLLAVAALFQLFDGAQVVGAGLLRGLSDMRVPTAITFVAYWCFMLPVAYRLGVVGHSPVGVWKALALGLASASVLLAWRFHGRTRGQIIQ
jgi:MATE family multidrug resistance protein